MEQAYHQRLTTVEILDIISAKKKQKKQVSYNGKNEFHQVNTTPKYYKNIPKGNQLWMCFYGGQALITHGHSIETCGCVAGHNDGENKDSLTQTQAEMLHAISCIKSLCFAVEGKTLLIGLNRWLAVHCRSIHIWAHEASLSHHH